MTLRNTALFILLILALLPALYSCKPKPKVGQPTQAPTDRGVVENPVAKGQLIFGGTTYSATGMSCANCHSGSPAMDADQLFIAHSAYGMSARGAWWITDQAQFDAKQGGALTLIEAANKCVSAPYMGGAKPIEGSDAAALEAFLTSIAKSDAKDAAPFIQTPPALPAAGLKPDMANGQRIYDMSCSKCHGVIKGIEKLEEAKDWLTPLQVMAKVRKAGDWFNDNKGKTYAYTLKPSPLAVAWFGLRTAYAQEPPATGAAPPAEGAAPAEAEHGEGEESGDEEQIFPENAMPYYASDILSDQDVVDVAFYVIEGLGKAAAPADAPADGAAPAAGGGATPPAAPPAGN